MYDGARCIIETVLYRFEKLRNKSLLTWCACCCVQDLVIKLDIRLNGNLQETIDSMMIPKRKFYARELHKAIDGLGTDERAISEILGTMDNAQILEVSNIYKNGES